MDIIDKGKEIIKKIIDNTEIDIEITLKEKAPYNTISDIERMYIRSLIDADIENGALHVTLTNHQKELLIDTIIQDDYLWGQIDYTLSQIYSELARGEYPHITSSITPIRFRNY